ncbi:MAG: molybdenum cofactor biosynthesis protein MoaE [Planctomycetota bacterium]
MIALQAEAIDPAAVLAAVAGPEQGGVVLFVGRVRNASRGRAVQHLDYEAYPEMALAELQALAEEAQREHGAQRVALVHRTGRLSVGETAVAIAVAAPHRRAAFAACSWLIDTLKERVPIWKKEWYEDGQQWISDRP